MLREHGGASAALIQTLSNPSFIARLQATKGLIKHFQLKPYKSPYGPLQRWCTLSLCKLPSAYREGAAALQELFRPLQTGIPLDESVLEYRPGSESSRLPGILKALNTKCQRMPAKRHWPPNAMSAAASQPGWVSLRVCQSRGTWILRKTRIRAPSNLAMLVFASKVAFWPPPPLAVGWESS